MEYFMLEQYCDNTGEYDNCDFDNNEVSGCASVEMFAGHVSGFQEQVTLYQTEYKGRR